MKDYLDRVRVEIKELEVKIESLREFTKSKEFEALDCVERKLLTDQLLTMNYYNIILKLRLKD